MSDPDFLQRRLALLVVHHNANKRMGWPAPIANDTSQVCFRMDRDWHKKLRVFCIEHDFELGDVMSALLRDELGI